MFVLSIICGWAQDDMNKNQLLPITIEGNVERVPDGTVMIFQLRQNKLNLYREVAKDTIAGGRFKFSYTPKPGEEEFSITTLRVRHSLNLYASPGTTTMVTGVGVDYENWYVKNDNPMQKIANEYRAYLDKKIPGYYDLRRRKDWIDEDDDEFLSVMSKWRYSDSLYVEYMIDYMKDREYNSVYAKTLFFIATRIMLSKNEKQRQRALLLLEKCPKLESPREEEYVYESKIRLRPQNILKKGDKLKDYVLYDHSGKEHHITEFNGNGKYLLLEFNSRTCAPCMEHRQINTLNNLYKSHSDKVEMLMVNCDSPYFWEKECKDSVKWGRDPWHEWNALELTEDVMESYNANTGPCYFFVSDDGTILGKSKDSDDLQGAINSLFKFDK